MKSVVFQFQNTNQQVNLELGLSALVKQSKNREMLYL